jgi:hypothetical protein
MRVANHDATKRFFADFPTQFFGHFGEDNAHEDAEFGGVRRCRREQGEWDATGEASSAVVGAFAKVHNNVDSARPHEIWGGHDVKHRGGVVPECMTRAFRFA